MYDWISEPPRLHARGAAAARIESGECESDERKEIF